MKPLVRGKETGLVEVSEEHGNSWVCIFLVRFQQIGNWTTFLRSYSSRKHPIRTDGSTFGLWNNSGKITVRMVSRRYITHTVRTILVDYFYREEEDFVLPITIHPDTSGRPNA